MATKKNATKSDKLKATVKAKATPAIVKSASSVKKTTMKDLKIQRKK